MTTPADRTPRLPNRPAHRPAHRRAPARRYTEGGERAVANFEAGMAGYETRAFRGLGVFVSMPVRPSPHPGGARAWGCIASPVGP